MTEEWRDIPGYEGTHQVSNLGRVRSLDRTLIQKNRWGFDSPFHYRGCMRSLHRFPNGYMGVALEAGGKCHLVHRLVAQTFIANPANLPEINHKNGVRDCNTIENLEWITRSDNHRHSYRELSRKQHVWTIPVAIVRGAERIEFPSELAAAKHLGVVAGSIRSAIKNDHLCRGWTVELLAA